jgi:hypothetical protein
MKAALTLKALVVAGGVRDALRESGDSLGLQIANRLRNGKRSVITKSSDGDTSRFSSSSGDTTPSEDSRPPEKSFRCSHSSSASLQSAPRDHPGMAEVT